MKNNPIKTYYPYYFADGTKCIVTANAIGQEWISILYELDRNEYNNWHCENRRHVSADSVVGTDAEPMTSDDYLLDELLGKMENETLKGALKSLTDAQRRLVDQIFVKRFSQKEIADMENVDPTAIRNRLRKIYAKIQRFFV